MIVRNEAGQLAECLGPVASLFDEIIVVDTGSQDDTKSIAGQFTPHVFDFPWCDDFAAARNESLRRATGDWIFWLDADDRLRPDQMAKLRSLMANLGDQPQAYLMDTVCASRYACEGARLISHARLFRRHPNMAWRGRVHEQLRPSPAQLGYDVIWSDVQIDHLGYADATIRQRKLNRDVRLLRMDYAVDPDDASTLVHLGLAYFRLGNFNEARKHLNRLLKKDNDAADYMRQVYAVLAECSLREGRVGDALATLHHSLRVFPTDENLLLLKAECHYELDQFEAAGDALTQIVSRETTAQYRGGVPGEIRCKLAPRKLGDVLRLQRKFGEAEAMLRKVVNESPDDTLSWHALGRVYIDADRRQELQDVVQRLNDCPQGSVFASLLLASWHLLRNELAAAGALIERLVSEVPQMPMPRLLRAEWLARSDASLQTRIQACRDLLRVQPGNAEAQRVLKNLEAAQQLAAATTATGLSTSVVCGAGGANGIFSA